jgi:hypothetical protein
MLPAAKRGRDLAGPGRRKLAAIEHRLRRMSGGLPGGWHDFSRPAAARRFYFFTHREYHMQPKNAYAQTLSRAHLIDAQQLVVSLQAIQFELAQLKRDHAALAELVARLKVAHVRHVTETHAGFSTPLAPAIAAGPARTRPLDRRPRLASAK